MCTEINVDGKTIETIGELFELVSEVKVIVLDKIYTQSRTQLLQPDFCLCPVDMAATAQAAGYSSRSYDPDVDGDNWFLGYKWVKEESGGNKEIEV